MRICPLIEKKSGPFQTLRFVGLRLMLDGKLILSTPATCFLSKQFETLYICAFFLKEKIFLTNLLLFLTKKLNNFISNNLPSFKKVGCDV